MPGLKMPGLKTRPTRTTGSEDPAYEKDPGLKTRPTTAYDDAVPGSSPSIGTVWAPFSSQYA